LEKLRAQAQIARSMSKARQAAGTTGRTIRHRRLRGRDTPLLEKMQGNWTPLEVVVNGKALAESMLAYGSRSMIGNETKVVFGARRWFTQKSHRRDQTPSKWTT